jgi:phosphoglycolate phosphatase-like HAD superfamily hydrolase
VLVSFDIDGTLEDGDPPGPIEMDVVRHAIALGYVVGSSSDRTVREQRAMWDRHGLTVDFVGHKHHLQQLAASFPVDRLVHVGDTDVDAHYARLAGFEFHYVLELPTPGTEGWIF